VRFSLFFDYLLPRSAIRLPRCGPGHPEKVAPCQSAADSEDASLFFRLVSYRYQRGSTAITTNKSVKDWPGILAGDEAMTAAVLDRLLHNCVVLNVRGRSYRLQELEKALK
jgi:DNA replication protein DnaC